MGFNTDEVKTTIEQSVQEQEPETSLGASFLFYEPTTSELLPNWGTHKRDRELRKKYRNEFAWVAQSAVAALTKRIRQTPWQLKGGRNLTKRYQRVLQNANFGAGWSDFLAQVMLDFLTCDYGAYIEVIGPGAADQPIRGGVTGLAHLDSLRCVPTGNLEYPVIYYSRRTGKLHRLHHTRVVRLVDMPDGDELVHGCGLSALSRAVSIMEMQKNTQQYVTEQTADQPPSGILYNSGINGSSWERAWEEYKLRRRNQNYKGPMVLNGGGANSEAISGSIVGFQNAPDGFDLTEYMEIAVNAFAAAFGIDRQDIWPLSGKMAGTATQSEILFEKARGMAFGDILQLLERVLNMHVLPPALNFSFEFKDEEKDKQRAERDGIIAETALKMVRDGLWTRAEARAYTAAQSGELRDVVTNADGEIVELPDDEVKPDDAPPPIDETEVTDTDTDTEQVVDETDAQTGQRAADKAIQATRLDFEIAFEDVLAEARAGNISRTRAGIILRNEISNAGRQAMIDGLEEGGVTATALEGEDAERYAEILAEQSGYVTNFLDRVYEDGISDAEAATKPEMWWRKSILPFFDAGRLSADKNGMYEFGGPDGEESCWTCTTLKGQRHRFRTWARRRLRPGEDTENFACGGWRCEHRLLPTDLPAFGTLPGTGAIARNAKEHDHSHAA
jgi:hypothetical protein